MDTQEQLELVQKQLDIMQEQMKEIDGYIGKQFKGIFDHIDKFYSHFQGTDTNIQRLQAQIDELRGYIRALADDMDNLRNSIR